MKTKSDDLSPNPKLPLVPEQGLGLRFARALLGAFPLQTPFYKTSLGQEADGPASARMAYFPLHSGRQDSCV